MELRTERLLLREFLPTDVAAVLAYQSKPAYLKHYARPPPSDEEVRAFVELLCRWAREVPRTKYQLAITLGGVLIGTCGVRMEAPERPEAEYGCELDPASWGHGYALEASHALLTFGQETLHLQRILARTTPGNLAAIRLAERLGFQRIAAGLYELKAPLRERPPS